MNLIRPKAAKSKAMMLASFAGFTAAFALVIWIKLRVVTTIPKQAYADPETSVREPRMQDSTLPSAHRADGH